MSQLDEILKEIKVDEDDNKKKKPKCPKCGSFDVYAKRTPSGIYKWRCRSCGFTWETIAVLKPPKPRKRRPPKEPDILPIVEIDGGKDE